MSPPGRFRARPMRAFAILAIGVLVFGASVWGALALWHQASPSWRWPLLLAWSLLGAAVLAAPWLRLRRPLYATGGIALLGLLAWWTTLQPSHHRIWADDVARLLEAEVDGNAVVLRNVRNFDWRSEDDYAARWETRTYDLDQIASADLFLSYWMGPDIAHTLVSFGFDDGRHIVFSLEIRKERGERFSAIGGFFRQFEQVLVAADERDIIRTRSNARGEDVYLYRLQIGRDDLRRLFLGYLHDAEALRGEPQFYNTLTSNCTTIVYDLARRIAPGLPLDYRLLLSGHFAEYVHDLGGLAEGYEYAQLQSLGYINARALAADADGEDFAEAIRRGNPGNPTPLDTWTGD